MKTRITRQRGVAAIYLVFLLIPLFGMVFLAIEGTRYIQKKNRLADAAEAAALAVSIANRSAPGAGGQTPQAYANHLAEQYVRAYVRHIDAVDQLQVQKTEGTEVIEEEEMEYIQYRVTATTQHQSWFASDAIPSFAAKEQIANRAVAKNYPIKQERNLDIVFVADFSNSMNRGWNSYKTKIQVLKEEINAITASLLSSQAKADGFDHRVGFVPFNMRTSERIGNSQRCITQLRYRNKSNTSTEVNYESVHWQHWGNYSYNDAYYCANNYNSYYCHGRSRAEARTVLKVFDAAKTETGNSDAYYLDPFDFIAFQKSVNKVFEKKTSRAHLHPNQYQNLYGWGLCETDFTTLELAKTPPKINSMDANGYTAVFQGLMRGAQVLADGIPSAAASEAVQEEYKRRAKMIIILSDGSEQPFHDTFGKLVDKGLCTTIRDKFKGSDLPLYIGVLGIAYQATEQRAFERCANEVIDVNRSGDLKKKIEELIAKGARTDGISRLYYRHSG
ncbi:TadE/TadG family type IV pilus assembly protein [Ferrimonas sp. SCSIO 43195]|uniref:TadE/TadG family type IV pilus assembly protein n=1 Tax=Ferrimonas sp. SCSIO 43195 TaxID=2822844 RepID=UPI002075FFDA|nr:pilus assembly protein TadG-related protein [Ferrimonas sp. SCSIO 43195]USD38800.1 pilus assembly protein [Ferrimonas sp. SCSIO 43195]